jgi:hypothetical protein
MQAILNDFYIAIPQPLLSFAEHFYQNLVPQQRRSGFNEIEEQFRGQGDFLDLLGSLIVFDKLGKAKKICSLELVCGKGDEGDVHIDISGKTTIWNIKTSKYAPFRGGLNLFVKEEELKKANVFGYMQVFVHLDETNEPHVHIAGICSANGSIIKKHGKLGNIPRTGHRGLSVPVEKLAPFDKLIAKADNKF